MNKLACQKSKHTRKPNSHVISPLPAILRSSLTGSTSLACHAGLLAAPSVLLACSYLVLGDGGQLGWLRVRKMRGEAWARAMLCDSAVKKR